VSVVSSVITPAPDVSGAYYLPFCIDSDIEEATKAVKIRNKKRIKIDKIKTTATLNG